MAVNERVAIRDGSYRADVTDPIAHGCCRLKVRETLTLTLSSPLALSRARRQEVVAMVITLHVYVACGGRIPHREARVLTDHQNPCSSFRAARKAHNGLPIGDTL